MMNDQVFEAFSAGLRLIMGQRGEKPAPLALRAGLSDSAIRDIFRRGLAPRLTTAVALADALGMSVEDIMAAGGWPRRAQIGEAGGPNESLVPVYDVQASAGNGALVASEDHIYSLAFDRGFLRQMTDAADRELCIISVQGHSMEPTLVDGDQVLVDRSKMNLSFDGLFVLRFDDALHVKRIGRSTRSGNVLVISDHPAYPTLDMAKAELVPIGRVLWYGRKV